MGKYPERGERPRGQCHTPPPAAAALLKLPHQFHAADTAYKISIFITPTNTAADKRSFPVHLISQINSQQARRRLLVIGFSAAVNSAAATRDIFAMLKRVQTKFPRTPCPSRNHRQKSQLTVFVPRPHPSENCTKNHP